MKKSTFLTVIYLFLCQSCIKINKSSMILKNNGTKVKTQIQNTYAIKIFKGYINFSLNKKNNPNTSNRIKDLIQEKFYNGSSIFKVIPNYFIQFGDPSDTGYGGSGKKILNENNDLEIIKGTLCLVRPNGLNSGDSILMIALTKIDNREKKYLAIGKVINGLEILNQIKQDEKIIFIKELSRPHLEK